MTITFISAVNGEVELSDISNRTPDLPPRIIIARSNNVSVLANAMIKHGVDAVMSSSMDFAKEYGFKYNNEALDLVDAAFAMANRYLGADIEVK